MELITTNTQLLRNFRFYKEKLYKNEVSEIRIRQPQGMYLVISLVKNKK